MNIFRRPTPTPAAGSSGSVATGSSTSSGSTSPGAVVGGCSTGSSTSAVAAAAAGSSPGSSTSAVAAAGSSTGSSSSSGKGWFNSLFKKKGAKLLLLDAESVNLSLNIIETWTEFSLKSLQEGTDNFNPNRRLGKDPLGQVFEVFVGPKKQKRLIAKRLDVGAASGVLNFITEMRLYDVLDDIKGVRKLVGYCAENEERLLVFEDMESPVSYYLFGDNKLGWYPRICIINGLMYVLKELHTKVKPAIIHGDINTSNIILHGFQCIEVVGLGFSNLRSPPATELALKIDIYNFGITVLELITGRREISEEGSLTDWAIPLIRESRFSEMLDPPIKHAPPKDVEKLLKAAEKCVNDVREERPTIDDVVNLIGFFK